MALQDEFDMCFPTRFPAGALVPSGTYICLQTLGPTGTIAYSQTTSDTTLPTTGEFWHALPTGTVSGSASAATIASGMNTLLNATGVLSPIAGNYNYTSANIAAWVSGDAMQSRGTGSSDA